MLINKTILVTGGAGAIGCSLVNELTAHNQIVVLDNLASGHIKNIPHLENVDFINASVLDDDALCQIFSSYSIDYVFHLAANFANQNSVLYPRRDLETNSLGTLKLLQYSQAAGIKCFVYTSSSCVYGKHSGQSDENTGEYDPETPYAISKLSGERYVNFYYRYWKLPVVITRIFNSYGPGEYPGPLRNVVTNFLWAALNKRPLVITGTGDETRDFTYVKDTVKGLLLAATTESAYGQVFNIGTGQETRIIDIARKILALTGSKSDLVFSQERPWDSITRRRANIQKARGLLGFEPAFDIDTGLSLTLAWFEKQKEKGWII
ncbi:MAG: NAD-dependent epimerase/dehydratase family protein [Syntrophomonas sp.]